MKSLRFMWLVSMVTALFMAQAASAAQVSKADAQSLVKKAVETYKAEGKDKLIAAVNTPKGSFDKGDDLHVFLYDMKGVLVANPLKPEQVGQNMYDKPDDEGKSYRKEIVDNAKSGKSGWVDYKSKNSKTGTLEEKSAYYEPAGDLIVISRIQKN